MKKLLLTAAALSSLACAKAHPRAPESGKPTLVLTVSPSIAAQQVAYGHFTARVLNGSYQCYAISWIWGDDTKPSIHEYPAEPFNASQNIHLYRTGEYEPKIYLQCLDGVHVASTRIKIGSENR